MMLLILKCICGRETSGTGGPPVVRLIFICIALVTMMLGCQTTRTPSSPSKTSAQPPLYSLGQPAPAQGALTPDQIVANDPCATRLHDIAGALLLYYALNKQFPPRLEDLASMADLDEELKFTCPVSGLHYVYVPAGLHLAGHNKRIIVHDAAASHNGNRWCIFISPAKPGAALAVEVLEVPEGIFRTYLSGNE